MRKVQGDQQERFSERVPELWKPAEGTTGNSGAQEIEEMQETRIGAIPGFQSFTAGGDYKDQIIRFVLKRIDLSKCEGLLNWRLCRSVEEQDFVQ